MGRTKTAQGRFWQTYPTIEDLKEGRSRAPRTKRLTARDIERGTELRRKVYGGRCPHDPACDDWKACVRLLATE